MGPGLECGRGEHETRAVALLCSLHRVGVSLGGRPVLREIELDLAPGQVLGVTGPNGSGKTTLIRTLATLVRVNQGEGHVLGANLGTDQIYQVRRELGMMGHLPAVIGELTMTENLEHVARLAGLDRDRAAHALDVVGLAGAGAMRADTASHGMIRRMEVARLLLTRPRLLLLDEATHGLDPAARELVDALIRLTIDRGGAAVLVSHDHDRLADVSHGTLRLAMGSVEAST